MIGTIKAITFDLDDTLWDVGPVIAEAEQHVHDWLARVYPTLADTQTVESLRELRKQLAAAFPDRAHDLTWLRKQSLAVAAESCGYSGAEVAEAAFDVFIEARHKVDFFDDALPALYKLSEKFRLAALSNGNADVFRLGMEEVFEFALSAIDVGRAKPHSAMFEAACRRLAAAPHEVLHVGDHPEHDVEGAALAGLRTAWINRSGEPWDIGHVEPDLVVADLGELVTVLLSVENGGDSHG